MKIRDAVAEDLGRISELESQIFASDAWSPAMIREELLADHRRYLVLVDDSGDSADSDVGGDDHIVGYAGVLVIGAEADVQTIAVAPEARGAGHGRALMNELLDEATARGAEQVFLEVRADNPAARNLYVSLGFEELGVRPKYYQPDNVDAVVMRRELGKKQ